MAHGTPRLETMRAFGNDAYRSGFWGLARVGEGGRPLELSLRARFERGGEETAHLATIPAAEAPRPLSLSQPQPSGGPAVAICMTTCDPPMELFARQIDSIRAQTHANWVCVISDDCSEPSRFRAITDLL